MARQRRTASGVQQAYRSGCASTGMSPISTTWASAAAAAWKVTSRGNSTSTNRVPASVTWRASATLAGKRAVEHDLGAAVKHGDGRRRGTERREGLVVRGRRAGLRLAREEVRGQADRADAVAGKGVEHTDGLGDAARAVVHAREEVIVEIDHAMVSCTRCSANRPSVPGDSSAWASSESVTRASAARRSSAAARSRPWATTAARACAAAGPERLGERGRFGRGGEVVLDPGAKRLGRATGAVREPARPSVTSPRGATRR